MHTTTRALAFFGLLACTRPDTQPAWRETPGTYCNPLDLDYAYIPSRHTYYGRNESHRSTADPVVVNYRDTLLLFSTNQQGYWWSADMARWHFVRHDFRINRSNDNVCAPGAWAWGDTLLFMPSHMDRDRMPLYVSTDPVRGIWTELVDSFPQAHAWDPSLFKDDDGSAYLYWGSSNFYPLYGVALDPGRRYTPTGPVAELVHMKPDEHGWERFGENHSDTTIAAYSEGLWMTKHAGRYYLQYAAPGTEWNVYADGVYVGDHPLGPFTYAAHNPFSSKSGGFITGAGHGSTFADPWGNYWHIATGLNWIRYKFERRLVLFPAGFDAGGLLYAETAFGDYPHYLPTGRRDHRQSHFTGWMLLSYRKPATASSSLPDKDPARAFDENIRSYWSAASADSGEYLAVDLGSVCTLHAFQVNYADEDVHIYDKQPDIYHQYRVWHSRDGQDWQVLVDKNQNRTDEPHDYVELVRPVQTRYLRLENVHMAAGKFAVAGWRLFGLSGDGAPAPVRDLSVERHADTREATLRWRPSAGAYAYQIRYGIAPDKLYTAVMVYGDTTYALRGLNRDAAYYGHVEALGEGGVAAGGAATPF
ncbi:MAG: family 43 glycosylhydrolase [Bacteroidia bacterium]